MKRLFVSLALLVMASTVAGDVHVRGYYRKDGTYVRPHYRSDPDGDFRNNWSTYPNVNPYTGKIGTKRTPPDSYRGSYYYQHGSVSSDSGRGYSDSNGEEIPSSARPFTQGGIESSITYCYKSIHYTILRLVDGDTKVLFSTDGLVVADSIKTVLAKKEYYQEIASKNGFSDLDDGFFAELYVRHYDPLGIRTQIPDYVIDTARTKVLAPQEDIFDRIAAGAVVPGGAQVAPQEDVFEQIAPEKSFTSPRRHSHIEALLIVVASALFSFAFIKRLVGPRLNRIIEVGQSCVSNMNQSGAQNQRILVIDDNPSIHKDWKQLLQEAPASGVAEEERPFWGSSLGSAKGKHFDIDSAFQGQEGLGKIRQALYDGRPYAMAIVDIRMPPGWDGVMTIERIWQECPNLPIVICAAYSDYTWPEIIERLGRSERLVMLKHPFNDIEVHRFCIGLAEKCGCELSVKIEGALKEMAEGMRPRVADAEQWRKGAEKGDVLSMVSLGCAYLDGCGGVRQDRQQGVRWLKEAACLGNVFAKRTLAEIGKVR